MSDDIHNSAPYRLALDTYLRTGDDGILAAHFISEKTARGGWRLPDEVIERQTWAEMPERMDRQGTIYAMPAATPTALDDSAWSIFEWLASECEASFAHQAWPYRKEAYAPLSVLRDPYSAKPYVLFYCEAPMKPSASPLPAEARQTGEDQS